MIAALVMQACARRFIAMKQFRFMKAAIQEAETRLQAVRTSPLLAPVIAPARESL